MWTPKMTFCPATTSRWCPITARSVSCSCCSIRNIWWTSICLLVSRDREWAYSVSTSMLCLLCATFAFIIQFAGLSASLPSYYFVYEILHTHVHYLSDQYSIMIFVFFLKLKCCSNVFAFVDDTFTKLYAWIVCSYWMCIKTTIAESGVFGSA